MSTLTRSIIVRLASVARRWLGITRVAVIRVYGAYITTGWGILLGCVALPCIGVARHFLRIGFVALCLILALLS